MPSPKLRHLSAAEDVRLPKALEAVAEALKKPHLGQLPPRARDRNEPIGSVSESSKEVHQVVERPSRDETLMEVAHVFAKRSTCSRAQVGAVIAVDGRILSTGYNGAPAGLPHCDHSFDPADASGCTTAVHAEANAIGFAAKYGMRTEGATLYTSLTPCLACAQLIINSGIVRVVANGSYRDPSGLHLLIRAHIMVLDERSDPA